MTDNALVAISGMNLPAETVAPEHFDDLAKSAEYLGRLQLYTKGAAVNKRLVGPGEFGIPNGEEIIVLGDEVDVLPLARRAKAIDLADREAIVVNYDPTSDVFKDIAARSPQQDSGCMYGVSFLVIERSTDRFLEFFCGTKSTRPEAGKIYAFLPLTQQMIEATVAKYEAEGKKPPADLEPHGPLPMTMKSKLVEKGSYSWHVPVVLPCSTPFESLPPVEKLTEQISRFLTPKDNGVETVSENEAKGRRAR